MISAICEQCKGQTAKIIMKRIGGLSQAAILVCVDCAYGYVSSAPIGTFVLAKLKEVENG